MPSDACLTRFPHKADSAEALRPMLERGIERGYAVGRACVTGPIRDATGTVIATVFPRARRSAAEAGFLGTGYWSGSPRGEAR